MLKQVPWRLVAVLAFVFASLLWWAYIFFAADTTPKDALGANDFPVAAEPICAEALARLDADGLVAVRAESPEQRAELVGQADAVLAVMVADLESIAPGTTSGEDARLVNAWLGDWRIWLEDRARWAATLASGQDEPFYEQARKTGEPNSKALDAFAEVNDMPSCATPEEI